MEEETMDPRLEARLEAARARRQAATMIGTPFLGDTTNEKGSLEGDSLASTIQASQSTQPQASTSTTASTATTNWQGGLEVRLNVGMKADPDSITVFKKSKKAVEIYEKRKVWVVRSVSVVFLVVELEQEGQR